jgi:hypothetical protein
VQSPQQQRHATEKIQEDHAAQVFPPLVLKYWESGFSLFTRAVGQHGQNIRSKHKIISSMVAELRDESRPD